MRRHQRGGLPVPIRESGSIAALAPLIGHAGVIAVLALMGLAGALFGLKLPDVER